MTHPDYLNQSKTVSLLKRIGHPYRIEPVISFVRRAKTQPVETMGIILVATLVTNTLLCWIVGLPVSLEGIFGRVVLCAVGRAASKDGLQWSAVRKSSFIVRKIEQFLQGAS